MGKLSLRQAAVAFAVSRTTLTKDLKSGKVSGVQDDDGQWQIDASELLRVYKPRSAKAEPEPEQIGHDEPVQNTTPQARPVDHDQSLKLARMEAELVAERAKTALLERHLDDLRRLLPSPDVRPRRRWWPW